MNNPLCEDLDLSLTNQDNLNWYYSNSILSLIVSKQNQDFSIKCSGIDNDIAEEVQTALKEMYNDGGDRYKLIRRTVETLFEMMNEGQEEEKVEGEEEEEEIDKQARDFQLFGNKIYTSKWRLIEASPPIDETTLIPDPAKVSFHPNRPLNIFVWGTRNRNALDIISKNQIVHIFNAAILPDKRRSGPIAAFDYAIPKVHQIY